MVKVNAIHVVAGHWMLFPGQKLLHDDSVAFQEPPFLNFISYKF